MMNVSLQKMIDKHEVISFDVFNTLLVRDVMKTQEIFDIMESVLIKKYGEKYKGFKRDRIKAEERAYKNRKTDEVTIEEIYNEYQKQHGDFHQDLLKIEFEIEKECINAREDIFEVYKYSLRKKKKILIISDMYLPLKEIESLLEKIGINSYDKIFLSSETGKTKRRGSIYKFIQEKEKDVSKWLHIGDDWLADYIMAKLHGIDTYRVDNTYEPAGNIINIKKSDSEQVKRFYKFINNRCKDNDYYNIGYAVFGPALYGTAKWIDEKVKEHGIKTMLFFARDGMQFKKAFDRINPSIDSRYLLVSRKSMLMPFLAARPSYELFLKVLIDGMTKDALSMYELVNKIGLLYDRRAENLIKKYNLSKEDKIEKYEFYSNDRYRDAYYEMLKIYDDDFQVAGIAFKKYLDELKIEINSRIGIFDIGWRGTIQFILEYILKKPVYGYYLYADADVYNLKYMEAYVAVGRKNVYKESAYSSIGELIFSADHGSVKKYTLNNDSKVLIEFSSKEHGIKEEEKLYDIRTGAELFCRDIIRHKYFSDMEFSANDCFCFLRRCGKTPTKHIIKLFETFSFDDGEILPLIGGECKGYRYFTKPKKFYRDLYKSRWKMAFLEKYFPSIICECMFCLKNKIKA